MDHALLPTHLQAALIVPVKQDVMLQYFLSHQRHL